MTAAEHLAMAYPALVAGAEQPVQTWALSVAQAYRPRCLSEERQNLAQAHYAAYLLAQRAQEQATGGSEAGAVTRWKEGDVEITYGEGASRADGAPSGPYAAWKAMSDICARGALITRFG
jgi:hypothetical protein